MSSYGGQSPYAGIELLEQDIQKRIMKKLEVLAAFMKPRDMSVFGLMRGKTPHPELVKNRNLLRLTMNLMDDPELRETIRKFIIEGNSLIDQYTPLPNIILMDEEGRPEARQDTMSMKSSDLFKSLSNVEAIAARAKKEEEKKKKGKK